jgi:phosphoribosylanthranilate isomerase
MPVRVKICGVTNLDDALAAVEAGADALGFNFWPGSKRYVTAKDVAPILEGLPEDVLKVGIFVNAPRPEIEHAVRRLSLGVIQLSGDEAPEECTGYAAKVIKSLRARAGVAEVASRYAVDYILLDADVAGSYGGTGQTFSWELATGLAPERLFLAGGLTPENVAEAVRRIHPYAVDVAGGVESEPRIKDHKRMREFIENAKAA